MDPWEKISLDTYENHMCLSQVAQLQALNRIMQSQWGAYLEGKNAAVLGIAGGNGLEHCGDNLQTVYGIDVNENYLKSCAQRFGLAMGARLKLLQLDLTQPDVELPQADLIIADLLIEYVGVENFCIKAARARAKTVSCVIQGSDEAQSFVSDSPYQNQFQEIAELHCDVTESEMSNAFAGYGYSLIYKETIPLPNGKRFIRLDYEAR